MSKRRSFYIQICLILFIHAAVCFAVAEDSATKPLLNLSCKGAVVMRGSECHSGDADPEDGGRDRELHNTDRLTSSPDNDRGTADRDNQRRFHLLRMRAHPIMPT